MRDEILRKLRSGKHLQVALDFLELRDALNVARQVADLGVILEAGTPLVKAEGVQGLLALRGLGSNVIVADTKTADAGDVEVEIAWRGKANIMTVLGIMDDSTIESAVRRARELDVIVQADLIGVRDVVKRSEELISLGVDIVGLHIGLDVQKKRGVTVADMKEEIRYIGKKTVLSVAGGLNPGSIAGLIDLPVSIYVVGGAITRSSSPRRVAEEIVNILGRSTILASGD